VGVAAVKGEQAETRAQRRKNAKSHGIEYEGLRRGSSSSGQRVRVVLWEETRTHFDSRRASFEFSFYFLTGYRGCASGLA
jgi:hypothetical protein